MSGFGETVAPRIDAVSVNGAVPTSDVRRASTVTSQTPGCGLLVVRLSAAPQVAAAGPAGCSSSARVARRCRRRTDGSAGSAPGRCRRRRRRPQVDLERRRARPGRGRSSCVAWLRPIVPVLRHRVVVRRRELLGRDDDVHRLVVDARRRRVVEVQDRRVDAGRRRVDRDRQRRPACSAAARPTPRRAEGAVVADPGHVVGGGCRRRPMVRVKVYVAGVRVARRHALAVVDALTPTPGRGEEAATARC